MTTSHKVSSYFQLKISVLIILLLGLLTACSSLQISQNYSLNNTEGLVFFSMTESGVLTSKYELVFISEDTKSEYVVSLEKGDHYQIGFKENDLESARTFDEAIGKLSVLRLPEGVYRFTSWSTRENKPIGENSLKQLLNKKFRVKNGHALYLGNLHLLNSKKESSLLVMDNRVRDLKLFYQRYPQVDKDKMLIASKVFLDPASGRDRVFDAYIGCVLEDHQLYSKKRLPIHTEPFRTLRVNSVDRKISRIDGYRLKFKGVAGMPDLNMKVELSSAKNYVSDKRLIQEWFAGVGKKSASYNTTLVDKGYFSEYQMQTNSLANHSMIYMVTMFDDASQIITNMSFVNPPDYVRSYKTAESFMSKGLSTVNAYQQCVVDGLNKNL